MIALVLGDDSYVHLLNGYMEVHTKDQDQDYDVVMFTGGADVSPALYGEKRHPSTFTNLRRDQEEIRAWRKHQGAKFVGICRGAQFLCVMNGDKLVQDCTGHTSTTHPVFMTNGDPCTDVTGDHHQMMIPNSGELLAYYHNNGKKEPEVVWYKDTSSLCVQYHPEWMEEDSDGRIYFNNLLEEYIL